MIIIGEIFSFLAAILCAISTFGKNIKKIFIFQTLDSICNGISNIFFGSLSGAVTSFIGVIRNILKIKNKINLITIVLIILTTSSLGIYFNSRGIVGFLPIIASTLYSIIIYLSKSKKILISGLIANKILLSIYDFCIMSYPMFVMDIIVIICSIYNLMQKKTNQ